MHVHRCEDNTLKNCVCVLFIAGSGSVCCVALNFTGVRSQPRFRHVCGKGRRQYCCKCDEPGLYLDEERG